MSISIPYSFTAQTTILSAEVNSNFSTLAAAALSKSGDTITGNISVNGGITIDGVDLSVDVAKVGSTATITGVWTFTASPTFSAAITVPSLVVTAGATIGTTLGVSGLSTLAGALFTDTVLQRPVLKDFAETVRSDGNTSTAITFDCELGNTHACTANGNFTATFSNPPATTTLGTLLIIITNDGTLRTATWPASVKWPSATAPTLTGTNGQVDIFHFITQNAGTTWYGSVVGQNL